ncbi:MAG: ATP-binding protein, partial [Acidobacteriota bacterium]
VPCDAKGLELRVEVDTGVPEWISADGPRIRQIVSNLVNNAIKFTERGSITIHATASDLNERGRLEISVIDTGIGFDAEAGKQIFGAFRQADESTNRRFGGSGLGLAISRGLADAMGGSISAQSSPGQGACFRFELPAPAAEPASVDSKEQPVAAAAKSLTILVADDEPVNRMILSTMLSELGHQAIEVEDGHQATERASGGGVDLIVLDMHMPLLDGPACARHLRSLPGPARELPILGLTADALPASQARFLDSGLDAVYTKPIDLRRLEEAIATTLSAAELRPRPIS